ncbi:hypothetical protein LOTGIDRAFT_155132 [Lottia gigantea]|uniref:Uncharacterized protein n=1 Tax=Lottia gigantea TaxID=225164 RepID=V3ZXE9_LOTGI|nr:hypothetical protein LOTGIDRAFT_155132 [Lottia gigantea]ESO85641.1 hypothetical protein LOTGIDRAFT_155132 [Lottia gigantea]
MTNRFGLGSLPLDTKKPNTTAWINKAKPYFVDQIGDNLQGENEDTFQHELTALETKLNSELQELTNIQQQIQNIDDSVIQQQITTINNEVLKQEKKYNRLEKNHKEENIIIIILIFHLKI